MSLRFLSDHTAPALRDLDERVVAAWNEAEPGSPVELELQEHEQLRDQIEDLLAGERPPDVMTWFAGHRTSSLTDSGLMLDLAPTLADPSMATYAQRHRPAGGVPIVFLPTSTYWWAVYYRRSVFASLGISTPVRTWHDLSQAASTLLRAGLAPFALGARYRCPAAAWFDYLDLRVNGPVAHQDLMRLRVPYTGPEVRRVLDLWRRVVDDGWFLGRPSQYDEAEAVAAVLDGRAGMTLIGAYVHDEFLGPDDDVDFFRFPLFDPDLPVGEDAPVDGYLAAARTRRPELARRFLLHLGSQQAQQLAAETTTALPTRTDVDLASAAPHLVRGRALLDTADHVSGFYDLDTPAELAETGMDAFVRFLDDPAAADYLLDEIEYARTRLIAGGEHPTGGDRP